MPNVLPQAWPHKAAVVTIDPAGDNPRDHGSNLNQIGRA